MAVRYTIGEEIDRNLANEISIMLIMFLEGRGRDGPGGDGDGRGREGDGTGRVWDGDGRRRDGTGRGRDGDETGRDGDGTGRGREGRDGDGTGTGRDWTGTGRRRDGTGVVAGWEVLEDEVSGQRRVPQLVIYIYRTFNQLLVNNYCFIVLMAKE